MNEIVVATEKKMTTAELAEVLGVSTDSIQNTVKKLGENFRRDIERNNQGGYLFTEEQATAIKLELQNHSKVNALAPRTTLEKQLLIQQAMQLQAEMISDLQNQVEKLTPAANFAYQLCDATNAIDIGECAKALNRGIGRNSLFELLRNKKILNENNIPYQKYIDAGYFRVIETKFTVPSGETRINLKTVVFQKGVAYINKLLSKEVA